MNKLKEKVLGKVTDDFRVLAKVVIGQQNHLKTLLSDDLQNGLYEEIEANERIIDSLELKIRNEVINAIVLYSPRATDLRMIISYYDMTAYLERIGDLLLNLAHFMKSVDRKGAVMQIYGERLENMLMLTGDMLQNAIFAFTCEDLQLARSTIEADDKVDTDYHTIRKQLQEFYAGKSLSEQEMGAILAVNSMAYNIERIGDNATNIAEAAIYLIEGKNIRHQTIQSEEVLRAGSEGESCYEQE